MKAILSHEEKYIDAGQKKCYFADPLPVYLLITVTTNARVNTRGSKMLPTKPRDEIGLPAKKPYTVWRMKTVYSLLGL